jgi:hypothetical protein
VLGSAASWTIAATVAAGCAGYPTNVAGGGACQRTVQCGPGLVCSQGHCTNDLSMFGNGHPTSLDSGLMNDGGDDTGVMVDAAPPDDANLPDTGVPNDAYVAPNDAFTPPNDAFTPPSDAFTPPDDAFVGDDAFVADDAFVGDDAGSDAGP